MENVRIIDSARRHAKEQGIRDEDILYVINHADYIIELDEYQNKLLYIGFDRAARNLEVITVELVGGDIIAIHAMKLRKSTLRSIEEAYGRAY
jgi:hypothetical protein